MFEPKTLAAIPASSIRAVFSDLDGTITTNGTLLPSTYERLCALRRFGLKLVLVSGRPAGWADCLMRLFPVDAIVFENGAGLALRAGDAIEFLSLAGELGDLNTATKLSTIFAEISKKVPGLRLAKDQPYRLFDYAIDVCEETPHLSSEAADQVLQLLKTYPGVTAKLSNIHINFWVGEYNKRGACEFLFQRKLLGDLAAEQVVFAGDSPNDEPLFEYFDHSVGTDNVREYFDRMTHFPKFICTKPEGFGFEELVDCLLKARTRS